MRMYDLISKKRNGESLTSEEIRFMISNYVDGKIPDYQMSAMLMAIYFQGMTDREIAELTMAMAESGDMIDLSSINGITVDKHSTGGVGDKTTFVVAPIVAACGGKVAKMSGRGLGHTGGTVDKMEAIPHIKTDLASQEFLNIVNEIGLCVIGQSVNLAPADKLLYALRDVTATVESIPLIASSIMSKKLAAGSDSILLDVKTGSGAFMKNLSDAIILAEKMVAIGEHNGRSTIALITDMNRLLGQAIGNSLEMIEVIETLKGCGPEDLVTEAIEIAANMLYLSQKGSLEDCKSLAEQAINNGSALEKLKAMIEAQGGDTAVVDDYNVFPSAQSRAQLLAKDNGYINHMNAEQCGIASVILGAGREVKDAPIDFGAGIIMHKKTGDSVAKGEVLAEFYTNNEETLVEAMKKYEEALTFGTVSGPTKPLVLARVTKDGVERWQ